MMNEVVYQRRIIRRLEKEFPGCFVMKNDPNYIQGLPDLLILFENTWFMLEVKISENAPVQPNQPHYVMIFDQMSYAAFIWPENEDEVFDALQLTFRNRR